MAAGSVSVVVRMKGVKESQAAMRMLPLFTRRGSDKGLKLGLEYLLKESQELVPVRTGTLKKSGKVIISGKGKDAVGKIIYTAPYAVWVHECITDYHAPPTQAKFLEAIMRDPEKQNTASRIIMTEIARSQAQTPGVRLKGGLKSVLGFFFGGRG